MKFAQRLPVIQSTVFALVVTVIPQMWLSGGPAYAQVRNDQLYEAIVSGDLEQLQTAIEAGGHVNDTIYLPGSEHAYAPLELAIRADNQDAALLLLRLGARRTYQGEDEAYLQLLTRAAQKDMAELIEQLLQIDTSSFVNATAGLHPVVAAARDGHIDSLRVLLDVFNDSVPTSNERTLILQGAMGAAILAPPGRAVPALELLRHAGGETNHAPYLAGAAKFCREDLVEYFLAHGHVADESFEGRSAAQYAADCLDADETREEGLRIPRLLEKGDIDD